MPHPHTPNPPLHLKSLHTKPSWHNRAAHTDRSACAHITARDIWPRTHFKPTYPTNPKHPPPTKTPIAKGTYTIYTTDVQNIIANHLPYTLQGDSRSPLANPMNPHHPHKHKPSPHPHTNPNKGATRTKTLALPHKQWKQKLTLHQYQFNPRLKPHYLICHHCQQRALKLFLPLCTTQEHNDALLAFGWLNLFRQMNPNHPGTEHEAILIQRYAQLFHPRRFTCRRCLNLRYGEVKPTPANPNPQILIQKPPPAPTPKNHQPLWPYPKPKPLPPHQNPLTQALTLPTHQLKKLIDDE